MKEFVYDVFTRKERGDRLQHVGYVDAFDDETRSTLEGRGHRLKDVGRQYGNMHALRINRLTRFVDGASDPRGEGQTISGPINR